MKTTLTIILLFLLFLFEIAYITDTYFLFIIIFNLLIIIASALSIELISKKIFSKSNFLNKHKKIIIIGSNTVLIISSFILLFLSSIEATRNDNALNKIRSLEIKAEITIPTTDKNLGRGDEMIGVYNRLVLNTENSNYFFISDSPYNHEQIATNTRKIYVTHRPVRAEELYGKQIGILEDIKRISYNYNGLIKTSVGDIRSINGTTTLKVMIIINSIHVSTLNINNIPSVEENENRSFLIDASNTFKDIENRYDKIQKLKIIK